MPQRPWMIVHIIQWKGTEMNSISKLTLAASLALGIATGPAVAGFKWIKTEKEYREKVVGRQVIDDAGNSYVIKPDGTLSGKMKNGAKVRGAWNWQGRYWCRNVAVNKKLLPTDCQKIEIDGNRYRMTREKGKGKQTMGQIK